MVNFLLAIFSGITLSISLPNFYIPFSFLIGFGIIFYFITKDRMKDVFIYPFLSGMVFSVLSFYWIVYAISYYGGLNVFLSGLLFLLFCVSFSIYTFVLFSLVLKTFYIRYGNRAFYLAPFIYTFFEFLREYIPFNGFPWNLSGYMLTYITPLAQITSFISVYGLSFFVVFLSATFFLFFKEKKRVYAIVLGLNILLLVAFYIIGNLRIDGYKEDIKTFKVAVIQGNIDESLKLNPDDDVNRVVIDKYVELMRKASKKNPDIIVLPESAIPIYPFVDNSLKEYFFEEISDIKIPLIVGFDNVILTDTRKIDRVYNSVFLMDKDHNFSDYYNKIKLVPFGEYTPFKTKLMEKIFTYLQGIDFTQGESQKILVYKDLKVVPLVCFESIFPDFVADFVSKNGNVIVNITNDGWFGKTSGPYQHFEMAKVRAIENGVYLVRAANTGISAVIDPVGRVRSHIPLMEEGYIVYSVNISKKVTFFNHYRSYIYLTFIVIFLTLVLLFEVKYRKNLEVRS